MGFTCNSVGGNCKLKFGVLTSPKVSLGKRITTDENSIQGNFKKEMSKTGSRWNRIGFKVLTAMTMKTYIFWDIRGVMSQKIDLF
jgi:hypothetical protein